MRPLTIGQVAQQSGVGIETIRFYEREGLLEPPKRKASGYRQYETEAISRLRFIRRAKDLGFTLNEIKGLLALRFDSGATRADVKRQAVEKIADIEAKIRDLERMRDSLLRLSKTCDGHGSILGCPILEALDQSEEE